MIVDRLLRAQADAPPAGGASPVPRVAPEAMALFATHAWPGNLRQLSSVLRTAALMARSDGGVIQQAHLPEDFLEDCELLLTQAHGGAGVARISTGPVGVAAAGAITPQSRAIAGRSIAVARLGDTTAAALEQALTAHGGNVSAAARALGVSRNTVYRHLKAAQAAGRPGPLKPAVRAR